MRLQKNNPILNLDEVDVGELKNITCILVASSSQKKIEEDFFRDVIGILSETIFAESLEEEKLKCCFIGDIENGLSRSFKKRKRMYWT